ncbi:MAG: hypothetical protein H3C62_13005 [Gemmatimonadaceae bacterium]|nr:hypothetical protein [Gemmatimonadaceae bacterium]
MLRTHCHRLLTRGLRCGERLGNRRVNGVTVPFCARCDCKRRGICVDCRRAPVDGTPNKAVRCAACRKLETTEAQRRYAKRHPGKKRAQWRRRKRRLLADPALRARELERKKLWRLANPAKKKRWAAQYNHSESARRYQRRYRAEHAAEHRAQERERQALRRRGVAPTHPCVSCGVALTGRAKKCEPCANAIYRHARAVLTGAAA